MRYKDMAATEGRKFLPKIKNIFVKPLTDEKFFVEPWSNRELGDCAEFRLDGGEGRLDEVLFFAADQETVAFLKGTQEDLYLFGAYNQVNVCQMRARGRAVLQESHLAAEQIRLHRRAIIESRVGACVDKLNRQEAEERYRLMEQGVLFSFRVSSYAYGMYTRG